MKLLASRLRVVVLLVVVALLAASCGGTDDSSTEPVADTAAASAADTTAVPAADTTAAPVAAEADGFPLTFTNCDLEFTLDSAPERVLLMEAAAPSLLFAAGAIDRVVARIEEFPAEYYTADEMAVLNTIPALLAEATATGGVEVSLEEIIATTRIW